MSDLNKLYLENQIALRTICHDLANPLLVILSSSLLCEELDNVSDIKNFVGKIQQAAKEQRSILDRVKSMQQLFTATEKMDLERVSIDDAAERAISFFKKDLEEKNLRLEFAIESDEDAIVLAETSSFQYIVMNNLISNSIKFSHPGKKIWISSKKIGEKVVLKVKDQGLGIPKELISKMLEFNSRQHRKDIQGEEGSGLGMPLLNLYVKRCGGELSIESQSSEDGLCAEGDSGTTVSVSFKAP